MMDFITSEILKRFLEQDKRKFEGLFPELVKRLILSSCQNVSNIRIPSLDDVWAPGFDGIVEIQEQTQYFAAGKSVWEFGTNLNSLSKINEDYQKRTNNPLGIDKPTTTFYLILPRIWAYDNQGMSKPKWESEHKDEWMDVHIYDASVICDWVNSEPAVCGWLFEQYGEGKHLNFSSVSGGWASFSNRTNPSLVSTLFLEGRQDEMSVFNKKLKQKMCRVKAESFLDAYGFCLSALMQTPETSNRVIVVNSESTYLEFIRFHKDKTFLLSFPFSGQVSDENSTILCYSKEFPETSDMIVLHTLWKSQFNKALCEMGFSNTQANECYSFTHGNLLSLIRRFPGNDAQVRPRWANAVGIDSLYPIIFLRQFDTKSDIEKRVLEMISDSSYSDLESKYESFLRMEDSPIKKVGDIYLIVNYEEAWMMLQVDVTDARSSRMQETIIALLTECQGLDSYSSQIQSSIIQRLILNYIYFRETGSNQIVINNRVKAILEYAKLPGCKEIILKSLPYLAEGSPTETLRFIEAEAKQRDGIVLQAFSNADGRSNGYENVLWCLDKLVMFEETSISACRLLYKLSKIPKEYYLSNSPKESLLNALCLWNNHSAVPIEAKKYLVVRFIEDDSSFGIPFAIELISKNNVLIGSRIGEKTQKRSNITYPELYLAHKEISSAILDTAIKENRADWIEDALKVYWYIPCEVLNSSAKLLATADFRPVQKMHIIYQIKNNLYYIQKGGHDDRIQWIESFEKWLECLIDDDPVSKEGWRFHRFYYPPFIELLSESEGDYFENEKRALTIREQTFRTMRDEYGISAVKNLIVCMEDSREWGRFLGDNLFDDEYIVAVSILSFNRKMQLLAGLIDAVDLARATQIYNSLSSENQTRILSLLNRDDIYEWLSSPELEQLYWQNKRLIKFDERAYHFLMKYNPCGLLMLFVHEKKTPDSFKRLIEVFHAIVETNKYSDLGLLTSIVKEYELLYYSEEWAELCLVMYDMSAFKDSSGYYPNCLSVYFFDHPEKMVEMYYSDRSGFTRHFHFCYMLPQVAYESINRFIAWADYIYDVAKEEPFLLSTLGSIMGRSSLGKDGIFPHDTIRTALEKYSDDDLTRYVASGWFNALGVRIVQDGLTEKKMELQYREYARENELNFPQTAKILSMIADFYRMESQDDQLDSELFPE
ncbi:MAG: hypothetical protein IKG47_09185 [Oscillospiraceae bacterium]|nr:hypothetical protein [Oscillospiraceae bacterium]